MASIGVPLTDDVFDTFFGNLRVSAFDYDHTMVSHKPPRKFDRDIVHTPPQFRALIDYLQHRWKIRAWVASYASRQHILDTLVADGIVTYFIDRVQRALPHRFDSMRLDPTELPEKLSAAHDPNVLLYMRVVTQGVLTQNCMGSVSTSMWMKSKVDQMEFIKDYEEYVGRTRFTKDQFLLWDDNRTQPDVPERQANAVAVVQNGYKGIFVRTPMETSMRWTDDGESTTRYTDGEFRSLFEWTDVPYKVNYWVIGMRDRDRKLKKK